MRVYCDDGNAKIRNASMGGTINNAHKYVHLAGRQFSDRIRTRMTTYTLEISVNHTAGVQIAETLCNLRQLVIAMRMGKS